MQQRCQVLSKNAQNPYTIYILRMKGRNIRLVFRGHILNLITFLLLFVFLIHSYVPFFALLYSHTSVQTKEMTKKRIRNKWMEIHHSCVCSMYMHAITQILLDMVFLHLLKCYFIILYCFLACYMWICKQFYKVLY